MKEGIFMAVTRKVADLAPIEDTVFKVSNQAREMANKIGSQNVINATIGALFDEEGELVAYKTVKSLYIIICMTIPMLCIFICLAIKHIPILILVVVCV